MKKIYLSALALIATCASSFSQDFLRFPVELQPNWDARTIVLPPSPLKYQRLFVGGVDMVQTTPTYGNPAGEVLAKDQHDFIGFTPATEEEIAAKAAQGHQNFLGWVSVNHEATYSNDYIGDGGGMTVFAVKRKADGTIEVIEQTLEDGRTGKFFNVDFVNTVGETGMNCGGIQSQVDGRIWTAEEWFRDANNVGDFRHNEFTINSDDFEGTDYNGKTLAKHESLNWMVEIDPRQAKAVRKQYNWGRAGWEGGDIAMDNKTVYLGEDGTPGRFVKFVADVAGDFTKGKTYVYNHKAAGKWVEIDNSSLHNMVNLQSKSLEAGMTMFVRLEWVKINKNTGKVYIAETGNDNGGSIGNIFSDAIIANPENNIAPHFAEAYKLRYKDIHGVDFPHDDEAALDSVAAGKFNDYYGRVLEYDPETGEVRALIHGGPYINVEGNPGNSPERSQYPDKHLTNPDGLGIYYINGRDFLLINEDLNGRSFGRVPAENTSSSALGQCETYMLDLSIENPTVDDLLRIAQSTLGAEIYGVASTPDGKTIFINNQHPNANNTTGVYQNALTFAVSGWDEVIKMAKEEDNTTSIEDVFNVEGLRMWPNPVARELNFNKAVDIAIYDISGRRVKVARNVESVNVQDLESGVYFVRTLSGETLKLVVE